MSSSLVDLMHENAGDRYPFDPVDHPPSPSSGSSERDLTPPFLARSLPSRGSSATTSTRRRHRKHDGHHRDDEDEGESSAKLLARIVSRFDQRDVKHVRTLLLITNDRLESETRRADHAEQRVVDALHRIRSANEATALAQADAVRAKQEVQLQRLQLDQAQHERTNMQEIIDRLEQSCKDAEDESARARSVARRLREELLSSKAREQGRKEGYEEGFARGRAMGLVEAQDDGLGRKRSTSSRPPMRRAPPVQIEVSDETSSESRSEDSPPVPVPVPALPQQRLRRPPSAPTEAPYTSRVTPPVRRAPLPPSYPNTRPPSTRPTPPHAPVHVPDVAPIVQTLPVPTITTPLNAPSPSHSRPSPPEHRRAQLKTPSPPRRSRTPAVASPQPLPVPVPASLRFQTPSRSSTPSRTSSHKPAPAPVPVHASTPRPAPAAAPMPRTPDPVPIPIHNAPPSPRHPRVDLLPDGYIPYAPNNDTSSIVLPPQHELSRPVSPIEFGPNGIPKPPPPDEFADEDDSLDSLPRVPPPGARSAASLARSHGRYTPSVASREYAYGGGDAPLPIRAPSTAMTSPQSRPSTLSHYDILGPRRQEAVYRQGVDRDTIIAGQGPPDRVYSPRAQSVEEHDRDSRSAWEKMFKKSQRSKHSLKGKEREYVPDIYVESPSTPNSTSKPNTAVEPPEPHLLSPEHARTGVVLPTLTDIFAPPDSQRTRPVPMPSQSPRYIPSVSPRPIPHQSPLPVPPPLPPKMYAPYAAAPVPDGVVYPAPPGRPQSRASVETGGPLSPISLGKPFSSFGPSGP